MEPETPYDARVAQSRQSALQKNSTCCEREEYARAQGLQGGWRACLARSTVSVDDIEAAIHKRRRQQGSCIGILTHLTCEMAALDAHALQLRRPVLEQEQPETEVKP